MIVVPSYYVGLGNNLFQYSWPRICAEIMGYEFNAPPLLNLETKINGLHYESPIQKVTDFELPYAHTGVPIDVVTGNHEQRKIIMWGFFQQANKYSQYRNQVKGWFKSSLSPLLHVEPNVLGVSIRIKDDYRALGWNLPLSYYESAVSKANDLVKPDVCLIHADVPAAELNQHVILISKYCETRVVSHMDKLSQLQSLMGCQNIIGCNSTFSWWATFLSNAQNIWMPHDWQPWGRGQDGDKTWPVGHLYPTDLRHHETGWHILYGKDWYELG